MPRDPQLFLKNWSDDENEGSYRNCKHAGAFLAIMDKRRNGCAMVMWVGNGAFLCQFGVVVGVGVYWCHVGVGVVT